MPRKPPSRPQDAPNRVAAAISIALPPELASVFLATPSTTDGDFLPEFGRLLFTLFLRATEQSLAETDPVLARAWSAQAREYSEELRKIKYLELQNKDGGVPSDLKITIHGVPTKPRRANG